MNNFFVSSCFGQSALDIFLVRDDEWILWGVFVQARVFVLVCVGMQQADRKGATRASEKL